MNAHLTYTQAAQLLREESPASHEAALRLLHAEADKRPADAKAWFELAGGYDFLGREAEALPFYQRVVDLGFDQLPAEDQPRLFVQMGSTLRNLKKYSEARELLTKGIQHFPDFAALKSFLGLVEYTSGAYREAAKLLLEASLGGPDDHSVQHFSRALRFYSSQIDTYPARPRNQMRISLMNCHDPGDQYPVRGVQLTDIRALGKLMHRSYTGTVDSEGETEEQCLAEMKETLEGKYGELITSASFLSDENGTAASASLITLWKGHPLLAFSMTDPAYQGRGLAGFLIRKSMYALRATGYSELHLFVTEGNTSAEKLYLKLGFEWES